MIEEDKNEDKQSSDGEADMDAYMDRAGQGESQGITIKDLKQLRNTEFIISVKDYLGEPNNKQLEIYVKHLKKNMILGFLNKADKDIREGKSTKSKGGLFMQLVKEFVFKTNKDEDMCVKIRDIIKKVNKNRNAEKSRRRKQKRKEQLYGNVVKGMKQLKVDTDN